MDDSITGGVDFGGWLMGVGDKVLTAAIDYKVNYPQAQEAMKINRLGQLGYYTEGQAGGVLQGIPPLFLWAGAAFAVYLLVKG